MSHGVAVKSVDFRSYDRLYRSFQWEVSLKIPVSEVRQLTTGIEQDLSISQ